MITTFLKGEGTNIEEKLMMLGHKKVGAWFKNSQSNYTIIYEQTLPHSFRCISWYSIGTDAHGLRTSNEGKNQRNLKICFGRTYLKIWDWEWIFGRAVSVISSPGVRVWVPIAWIGSKIISSRKR